MLCTGNSARSILCEALINHYGHTQWRALSAGSRPSEQVHPITLQTLQAHHIATTDLRSKGWDEFTGNGAPRFDVVITVCEDDAEQACPAWHGSPLKVHWDMPDPEEAGPDQQQQAFETAFITLQRRIKRVVELPLATLDRDMLQTELRKLALVF